MEKKTSGKNWSLIRQIDVGTWKEGWIAKDDEGNVNLIVTVNRERYGAADSIHYAQERFWQDGDGFGRLDVYKTDHMDKRYKEESHSFVSRMEKFVGLKHANIAELVELGKDDKEHPTATMEYWTGEPIVTALQMAHMRESLFLAHFKQVFEGLAFIQRLGMLVLHWKPRMILSDLLGGTTKIVNIWDAHTPVEIREKKIDFNPLYAAPEVIKEEEVDERADLYSVAAIMLETWRGSGHPVFNDTRSGLKLYMILNGLEREKEFELMVHQLDSRGYASKELGDEFVLKLLKKNPADRGFKNAREVVNYIVDTWPDVLKPAKDLYGRVMTTMRL